MNTILDKYSTKFILLFLTVSSFAIFPNLIARADAGPKPEMEFKFVTENPQQTFFIQEAVIYECQQADCSDAQPIDEIGPQRLYCQDDRCTIYFYGLEPYYQLEVISEDGKVRTSQAFAPTGFHSYYLVTVRENDLVVKSRFAFDLLSAPICLSVCGSLWIAAFAMLFWVFGLNRR